MKGKLASLPSGRLKEILPGAVETQRSGKGDETPRKRR